MKTGLKFYARTFATISFSLILLFGGGCSDSSPTPVPVPDPPIDTSFLELEDPGTYIINNSLITKSNTFETNEDEIESIDESLNLITLSDQANSYGLGDILIGSEETRFAKKIVSIEEVNGKTVLTVEDAELEEIFEGGTLSFSLTPDWRNASLQDPSSLQKPLEEYFTPSKSERYLSSHDVSSNGTLNLDGTSLFMFKVTPQQGGGYGIDWNESSMMGLSLSADSNSTCQGCCSYHGGAVCEDGVTKCADGTDLSASCAAKGCNECPPPEPPNIPNASFKESGVIKGTITEGRLNVVPTIVADYDFWGGLSTNCRMDMLITFDATVEIESQGVVSFEFKQKLLPTIKVPVAIPAGPVPVYLDIELDIPAKFLFEASITGVATFKYNSQYSVMVDMAYSKSGGFIYDSKMDKKSENKEVTATVLGSLESKLSLQPTVTVRLYKILGPSVTLEPYIKGVLSTECSLIDQFSCNWAVNQDDLYLGMSGFAGLKITGFKRFNTPDLFDLYYSWDLLKPGDSPQPKTWYLDYDGDGFGNSSYTDVSVAQPDGYVSNSNDIDDSDDTIYPGAPEICDDKDNDGDGLIDEECSATDNSKFIGEFDYSLSGTDPDSCSFSENITVGSDYSQLDGRCGYLYIPLTGDTEEYTFIDCDGDEVSRTVIISDNSISWKEIGECLNTQSPCWAWNLTINFNNNYDSGTISGDRYDEDVSICQGTMTGTFANEISGEVSEEGLVAYYPFDGNAYDKSENHNNGELYGVQKDSDKFGNPDSSYNFDGINDYIDVPDHNSLDTITNFSISVWFNNDNVEKVNPANGDMVQTIVQYGKTNLDGKNNSIMIRDRVLEFVVRGLDSDYEDLVGTTIIQNKQWYHAVLTYNGNIAILYLNGNVEDSNSVIMALNEDSGLLIGKYKNPSSSQNHYFFDGIIDNVRIYDYALPEPKVKELFNLGN